MADAAKNFAKVTVTDGYLDIDTSIDVDNATRLPAASFNAVWWNVTDYPDPADDPDVEIVRVTNIATNTLTITRGQEGTAAADHSIDGKTYQLIAPLTAKFINDHSAALDRLLETGTEFRINDNEAAVLLLDRLNGVSAIGDVDGVTEGTKVVVNDPATTVTITKQLILPDLPSSDPAVAGALYYDAVTGIVKRSAG
jgi:hypothetical protein